MGRGQKDHIDGFRMADGAHLRPEFLEFIAELLHLFLRSLEKLIAETFIARTGSSDQFGRPCGGQIY